LDLSLARVVQALLFRYVHDDGAHAFPPLRLNELDSTRRNADGRITRGKTYFNFDVYSK
jgi:hypothetical protein